MSFENFEFIYFRLIESMIIFVLLWVISPKINPKYFTEKLISIPIILIFLLFSPMKSIFDVLLFALLIIMIRWRLFYTKLINACIYTINIFVLKYLISYLAAYRVLLYSARYMGDRVAFYSKDHEHILFSVMYLVSSVLIYRLIVNQLTKRSGSIDYTHRMILFTDTVLIIFLFVSLNALYRYFYTILNALLSVEGLRTLLFIVTNVFVLFIFLLMYLFNTYWLTRIQFDVYQTEAAKDALTGILNRASGMQRLSNIHQNAKETGDNFVICFADVNNLKITNDRYGHNEGDQMLKSIANEIVKGLRGTDFVFRYGGDEFVIVFNNCKLLDAQNAWHRINAAIEHTNAFSKFKYRVSVSYGFSSYDEHDKLTLKEIIELADSEMYKYKHKYKSRLI